MAELSPFALQQGMTLMSAGGGNGSGDAQNMAIVLKRDADKQQPQWGYNETKKLIEIRAELEKDFVQTKRNKTLWELISRKMKEHNCNRSAEQCKCKWKNLVKYYKGKETSEAETGRQCPFFDELDAIFKQRAKDMDPLLLESERGLLKRKEKRGRKSLSNGQKLGDDESDNDDDDDDDESEEDRALRKRARRVEKERQKFAGDKPRSGSVQEVLEDFFKHQQWLEVEWREAVEHREAERRAREAEFRDAMVRLEQQRAMREAEWRMRDEQRRLREESRSEKMDQLLEVLKSKLMQE